MANCPNCGKPLSEAGICEGCGFILLTESEKIDKYIQHGKFSEALTLVNGILNKDPNDGKACLDMVRILTKNFAEKPDDKEACLDYAVRGLTYASSKDKANIEFKLLAYFENLQLGGRGVENVFDLEASVSGLYLINDEVSSSDSTTSVSSSPLDKKPAKTKKTQKPKSGIRKILRAIFLTLLTLATIRLIITLITYFIYMR